MFAICLWLPVQNQQTRFRNSLDWIGLRECQLIHQQAKENFVFSGCRKNSESPSFCWLQVVLGGEGGVLSRKVWACLDTHTHTQMTQKCATFILKEKLFMFALVCFHACLFVAVCFYVLIYRCVCQQTLPISRLIVCTSNNMHGILKFKKKKKKSRLQTENVLQGSRKCHFQFCRANND